MSSGRELCQILEDNGFQKLRQRGSHRILHFKHEDGRTQTVPVPMHATIRRGTLVGIIRQSGLPRRLFEAE